MPWNYGGWKLIENKMMQMEEDEPSKYMVSESEEEYLSRLQTAVKQVSQEQIRGLCAQQVRR